MEFLIICALLGVASHYYAIGMVAYEVTEKATFEEFMKGVLSRVYAGIVTVLVSHYFLGPSSYFVTLFVMAVFFTLCRIDYEDTFDTFHDESE